MAVLFRYSNHPELADTAADVLERLRSDKEATADPPPAEAPPIRQAWTHRLSEEQVQVIFRCYRTGTAHASYRAATA